MTTNTQSYVVQFSPYHFTELKVETRADEH